MNDQPADPFAMMIRQAAAPPLFSGENPSQNIEAWLLHVEHYMVLVMPSNSNRRKLLMLDYNYVIRPQRGIAIISIQLVAPRI